MTSRHLTLPQLRQALAGLDLSARLEHSLAGEAARLANVAREDLATLPGGPHTHPWKQTGTLHDSVSHRVEGPIAEIGSPSPIARYQEHGTETLPPRPTFGPLATREGAAVAQALAQTAHDTLTIALGRR